MHTFSVIGVLFLSASTPIVEANLYSVNLFFIDSNDTYRRNALRSIFPLVDTTIVYRFLYERGCGSVSEGRELTCEANLPLQQLQKTDGKPQYHIECTVFLLFILIKDSFKGMAGRVGCGFAYMILREMVDFSIPPRGHTLHRRPMEWGRQCPSCSVVRNHHLCEKSIDRPI